ncbi:hypothetical protein J6590_071597 [Homalodisca vitripennis]|nr:hypothetical protein J6590_071597 [Homalodisca vitripennis]
MFPFLSFNGESLSHPHPVPDRWPSYSWCPVPSAVCSDRRAQNRAMSTEVRPVAHQTMPEDKGNRMISCIHGYENIGTIAFGSANEG